MTTESLLLLQVKSRITIVFITMPTGIQNRSTDYTDFNALQLIVLESQTASRELSLQV
jgi:hypothetical protein